MTDLRYPEGIAAARTMIALEGDASALQRRLPNGWELAPTPGTTCARYLPEGRNMLVPFHEVYADLATAGATKATEPRERMAEMTPSAISRSTSRTCRDTVGR